MPDGYWSPMLPPPLRSVAEWADAERMLSRSTSAMPGAWRTSTTPYLREPMERMSAHDPCETVVLMFGSQLGKSEALNNAIGSYIHDQPGPTLLVQPTLDNAKRYSEQRIAPMIAASPALRSRVAVARGRDGSNKLQLKTFPGGVLVIVGANAPADLASMPIRYLLLDEVDRFPASAGAEGDPVELAIKRTSSFSSRKIILTSTPTVRGRSRVEEAMLETGWREYHVPCPHCDHRQPLVWEQMRWETGKPKTAMYHCRSCGTGIEEGYKREMLPAGLWVPRYADREDGSAYGYHISTLCAPSGWTSAGWAALVREYEASAGNPQQRQVFVNTRLAETFDESEASDTDPDTMRGRAELFDRPVPDGVKVLTAGVDVQVDRIEVEIVGWGDDEESWSIEYAALPGDTTAPLVWDDLDEFLARPRDGMHVMAACVDSGYLAEQVQRWCHDRRGRRVWAVKGTAGSDKPIWPKRGSRGKKGTGWRVWLVGVDGAKDVLWRRWPLDAPGPGFCHVPADRDAEWFRQVLAERPTTTKGGKRAWVTDGKTRSEALDCRVYAYAALMSLTSAGRSLSSIRQPARPDYVAQVTREEPRTMAPAPKPARRPLPKRRGSWLDPGARRY